jgi:acyl-CoA reductase-like NAD-dependent aldehyde dehydrogenase
VLVQESRFEELVARLAAHLRTIRVGPDLDEASQMGPLITQSRLESVLDVLGRARANGAEVAFGGERSIGEHLRHGWFLQPTLLQDVGVSDDAWQTELFAPVLALMPVDTVDGAIELVNRSPYGLSASIFTRDLEEAHRFAAEVEVGCVALNLPTAGWDVHMPFGGFKDSGSSFKEHGVEALSFYTRTKTVAMRTEGISR